MSEKNYTAEELEMIRQARNAYHREYYRQNRERIAEINRRSRQRRREKIAEYQREYWLRKARESLAEGEGEVQG